MYRFPVYDVETQHSFQDKAPAHHETKYARIISNNKHSKYSYGN